MHFRHVSAYYQVMFNTNEQFLFYNFKMIIERNKLTRLNKLVFFISFSVVSTMSPIMMKVSDT